MDDDPNHVQIFITTYFAHGANDVDTWQARGGTVAAADQYVIDGIREHLVTIAELETTQQVANFYRANSISSKNTLAAKSKPYMVQLASKAGATAYMAWNYRITTITFLKNANHLIPASAKMW